MVTSSHDPSDSIVKLSGDQFSGVILRYIPNPKLGDNASRINLAVSVFRWQFSIPRAITVHCNKYLDLVVEFGYEEDRGFVEDCLDTFSSRLSRSLHPDVAIDSVREILAKNLQVVQISTIVSVRASTLAVAARDFALTYLGQQNEFCPLDLPLPSGSAVPS